MESKIIKQEKNPFLKREEITLEIFSEAAPTEAETKVQIGKDETLTVIKKINTNFGKKSFLVEAVVYDTAEDKKEIEVIPKKIRKKMEEEEKARIAEEKKKAAEEAETKKKAEEEAAAAAEEPKEESTEKTKSEEETPEKS